MIVIYLFWYYKQYCIFFSKRIRSNSTDVENNDSSCCKSDDSKILTVSVKTS